MGGMKRLCALICALLVLVACQRPVFLVQTDYISHKNLASFYVGTPDPRLNMPSIGQRLIITWILPGEYLSYEDLHLEITIRFRNREEVVEYFDISHARGTYVFSLLNQDYICKRGILTYKFDLVGGGCILKEWRHLIWNDLITIPHDEELVPNEEDTFNVEWEE
jgi:hypothetical protein